MGSQRRPLTDEDLDAILVEMFNRVGEDYHAWKAAGKLKDNWYATRAWTEADQEDFAQWLAGFLKEKKYCKGRYRNQDAGYHLAWKFLLPYGWTTGKVQKLKTYPFVSLL